MSAAYDMTKYDQLIEGLQKAVEPISSRPPGFDLSGDITRYAESLRYVPAEQRPSKIVAYIRPLVDQALAQWRASVDHGHGLLVKLHNAIEQIEADKSAAEAAAQTAQARIRQEELKRDLLRKKEAQLTKERADIRPVTAFAQWSYKILIAGSIVVAFVTAWYYLNMQVSIQAAKQGIDITASAAANGKTAFNSSFDYLMAHPADWIYAFGVVVFLLAGKIVSTIHARLRHPSWLFISVAALAVATTVGTVALIGMVASAQQNVAAIDREIARQNENNIVQQITGAGRDCESIDRESPECAPYKRMQDEKKALTAQVGAYGFWMTIAVLLAEILLGAVAWMLASEHHEKHGAERDLVARRLEANAAELAAAGQAIEEHRKAIAAAQQSRVKADMLIHELQSLQPRIPGEALVSQTCTAILNEQIQRGEVILAEMLHRWKLEESVPPAH